MTFDLESGFFVNMTVQTLLHNNPKRNFEKIGLSKVIWLPEKKDAIKALF